MLQDLWFPLDGSRATVGRFVDTVTKGKREDGTPYEIARPALEAKPTANSNDISFQVLKDFERDKIIARCPEGWAYYQKMKAAPVAAPTVPTIGDLGIKGTPIEDAAVHCGWNNERLTWFKSMGIMTVEQVAALSDSGCQSMGRGAVGWRKKAKEFLADK